MAKCDTDLADIVKFSHPALFSQIWSWGCKSSWVSQVPTKCNTWPLLVSCMTIFSGLRSRWIMRRECRYSTADDMSCATCRTWYSGRPQQFSGRIRIWSHHTTHAVYYWSLIHELHSYLWEIFSLSDQDLEDALKCKENQWIGLGESGTNTELVWDYKTFWGQQRTEQNGGGSSTVRSTVGLRKTWRQDKIMSFSPNIPNFVHPMFTQIFLVLSLECSQKTCIDFDTKYN